MKTNDLIRAKRQTLGMSDEEVARAAGISVDQYGDVEQYPDEFASSLTLSEARNVCAILGIEIIHLAGLDSVHSKKICNRAHLIKSKRELKKMSAINFSSKLGFDISTVQIMESDKDFLEAWPLDLVLQVASVLEIDPKYLIDNTFDNIGQCHMALGPRV